MVQVQVNVSNLAIDLDGNQEIFKRGAVFDCPVDRAAKLGNSVTILDIPPVIAEPEPNPPDVEEVKTYARASTTRKNRR